MSDKVYIGRRVLSIEKSPAHQPFSEVEILCDDKTVYVAGDASGRVLSATCPWVTQAITDDILLKVAGFVYTPFSARGAAYDPSVELGDGVTVDGVYAPLAIEGITFDRACDADIEAPAEEEIDHEIPYKTPMQREVDRKIARTRSMITKTAEEIRQEVANEVEGLSASFTVQLDNISAEIVGLENAHSEMELTLDGLTTRIEDAEGNIADLELTTQGLGVSVEDLESGYADLLLTTQEFEVSIEDLEGNYADLALTLDGLTVTDSSGTTRVKGSSIETETLFVDAANINGTLTADQIVLTGSITWNDLASGVQSTINGAYSAGLSESDVKTIINNQLVLSPNIAGGKFYNLGMDTWIEIGSKSGAYGLVLTNTTHSGTGGIFAVYNGDFGYTSFSGKAGHTFLAVDGATESAIPQGDWDFSNANVTGLTPKLAS